MGEGKPNFQSVRVNDSFFFVWLLRVIFGCKRRNGFLEEQMFASLVSPNVNNKTERHVLALNQSSEISITSYNAEKTDFTTNEL